MNVETIAVVIGISQYLDKNLINLPAAQVDALDFARSLRNWGVPESNIALFLNSEAITETIDQFFNFLLQRKKPFKFIFYFCGHGYRNRESTPKSYLLLYNSFISDINSACSLSLDSIIEKTNFPQATESYIFIDACSLRINTLIHPNLSKEVAGEKFEQKNLFCILSSGIKQSFECIKGNYGYFTHALLNVLSKMSKQGGSSSELSNKISLSMQKQNLHLPEAYCIGNQKIAFIPKTIPLMWNNQWINRHELIAQIQNLLIQNKKSILCLVGKPGIGKSTICKCLSSEKMKTIYSVIPLKKESFNILDFLLQSVMNYIDFELEGNIKPVEIIRRFSTHFPYYTIIIDQSERLKLDEVQTILEMSKKTNIRFVLSSNKQLRDANNKPLFIEFEIPKMSIDEGIALMKMLKPEYSDRDCELTYIIAQGNPLNLVKIVSFSKNPSIFNDLSLDISENEIKNAISALVSCGSYVNEYLFCKIMGVNFDVLNFLESLSLIKSTKYGKVPHDLLQEIAEAELIPIQKLSTIDYWCKQLDESPDQMHVAENLLFAIISFGYEKQADNHIKRAFEMLSCHSNEHRKILRDCVPIFLQFPKLSEAAITLAEILTEAGEFESSRPLLIKHFPNQEIKQRIMLCQIQEDWFFGRLNPSIQASSNLIADAQNNSQLCLGYFFRAISHFLSGQWNKANSDFQFILENRIDQQLIGRTQCLLGSAMEICGAKQGREYLETGIATLNQIKDLPGLWMGWNNLGEILWKSGEYKLALFYLEKALELSNKLSHQGAILETLKNLLQIRMILEGPLAQSTHDLVHKIENFDLNQCRFFERLQILNSLLTFYIYQKNVIKSTFLLKEILPKTAKNENAHIYSCANFSLLALILGHNEKHQRLLKKAIRLAKQANNVLAIRQIEMEQQIAEHLNFSRSSHSSYHFR